MTLTEVNTEKVYGRISNVHIGYDETHGVNISKGIVSFEPDRVHDATSQFVANTKTSSDIFQPHSNYTWKLRFLSDCKIAFFGTDVQVAEGDQYALTPNGDSNKIEYFRVILPIQDGSGVARTRTYIIQCGYCTRNYAFIGEDQDAIYEYSGIAEYIYYSDA